MIPAVEMLDTKPTSDNLASSDGNRRTIGEWFRTVMPKRSDNRTPRQTPSETLPQSGIPLQTEATPRNEQPSTMAPGRRQKVSPFPLIQAEYLTTRLSGRLESPLLKHRLVHVSYPFVNIITYYTSQKKATTKPAALSKPPKTTPANVPDETTQNAEPSDAQNNLEVRIYFVHLAAGAHNNCLIDEPMRCV